MAASIADPTCLKTPKKTTSGKSHSTARVIVNGLIKLVEGQKRFAEEFGLPFERVFRHTAEKIRHEDTRRVICDWLKDNDDGQIGIANLLTDIIQHNIALYEALDGIATESLSQLSPTTTRSHSLKLWGWRPFVWRTFRRRHHAFRTNEYLRHQQLVIAGFSKAYDYQRLGQSH